MDLRRRATGRVEVNLLAWAVGHRRSVNACRLGDCPLGVAHEFDVMHNLRALLVVEALEVQEGLHEPDAPQSARDLCVADNLNREGLGLPGALVEVDIACEDAVAAIPPVNLHQLNTVIGDGVKLVVES